MTNRPVRLSVFMGMCLKTLEMGNGALKSTSVELGLWSDVNDKQFDYLGDSLFS
jgi:hypothetical protein